MIADAFLKQRLRGAAGWFVRGWLVKQAILIAVGLGMVIGLVFGPMFFWLLPQWIGFGWTIVVWGTTAVGLVIAIFVKWNIENLRKGLDAEMLVGQTIERAMTAENCAVAHSVKEIAEGGDIDHIIATPKAVWVIETKYKKVRKDRFPKVLDGIATNMDAVRQWAVKLAPDKETRKRLPRSCL
ncbi:MAG: nuclease-related domain-containing protein [Deltaproteobacteria bacterium]|nr:nuclease-related domain-containing protein [Deltaproteobacteria bacterium]